MTKERSGDRSAECRICHKTFARSDTLLRHEKSHHATEDRGPVHRVTTGTFRACSACATARSRCSGGTPCGRCNLRKIECAYPNKRRKGESNFDFTTTKPQNASENPPVVRQYSDIVFAANEQYQSDPSGNSPISTSDLSPSSARHRRLGTTFNAQPSCHEPYQPAASAMSMHVDTPAAIQPPRSSMPNSGLLGQIYGNAANQYEQAFDGRISPSYGYNAFEDSMNWIPISVFPSPDDGLEQDFSFLLPSLSSTLGIDASDYGAAVPIDTTNQVYRVPYEADQLRDPGAEASEIPMPLIGLEQSPASSTNKSTTESTGPSDGKKRWRKSSAMPDIFAKPRNTKNGYAFPLLADIRTSLASSIQEPYCSEKTYTTISTVFRKLCIENDLSIPFQTDDFPDNRIFNFCIQLYFKSFHSTLPLIHKPTYGNGTHWLVVLATATVGSTFVRDSDAENLREGFQEFLRRAIHQSSERAEDYHLEIALTQARILNLISLSQSGREELRALTPKFHAELSSWCLELGMLQLPETFSVEGNDAPHENDLYSIWIRWRDTESLRRVGYIAWLLDTSLGYLASVRPLCNMDDARAPLPCPGSLWEADLESWQAKLQSAEKTPSLCAALEELYARKIINPSMGELSQTLLINALFQRTWEVGTHIKQPLSEWVPTGKARGFLNTPIKDNFWLPLYPLYANWRNSACDCLDTIHWQAAAQVAKAAGVENGLVLHLHLARIVLLTPFQEIQDLILSLVGKMGDGNKASFYVHDGSYQPRNHAKLPQIRKITWRWLRDDQHKARLAVIHAGSVFWHVRRYSTTSFYEPTAVYLASIILWTYASYKSSALERDSHAANARPVGGPSGPDSDLSVVQPSRIEQTARNKKDRQQSPTSRSRSQGNESSSGSDSDSSTDQPEFIHLDRPADNEMVQHFVRNGHNMTGHMSNVGDICKSPQKVLLEGSKLLRTKLGCWGVSVEYYDILTKLAELRKGT